MLAAVAKKNAIIGLTPVPIARGIPPLNSDTGRMLNIKAYRKEFIVLVIL